MLHTRLKHQIFAIKPQRRVTPVIFPPVPFSSEAVTEVNGLRLPKFVHLRVDHIKCTDTPKMSFLSARGAEELTVYL